MTTSAERNEATISPPRLFTLGERTFLLATPTLSDSTAIAVEGKRLLAGRETPLAKLVKDPAFSKLPASCQVAATQEAARVQVNGQQISGTDLAFEMASPPLLAFAVWLLAHREDANLTLAEVRGLITEENAGEAFVRFVEASGILKVGEEPADPFAPGPSG